MMSANDERSWDWCAVDEELPDCDSTVLVFEAGEDDPVYLGYWDGEFWRDVHNTIRSVSHWMELPEPPSAGGAR